MGVIASIVFLALEIRQNTVTARASAYQAIGIATASLLSSDSHDEQFVLASLKTADELTALDWARLRLSRLAYSRLGETIILQVEQGLLPPDAVERLGYQTWKTWRQSPIGACLWPSVSRSASETFRQFVEDGPEPITIDCTQFDEL